MSKPNVIFILGPPGAGKGTHCVRIAKDYNFVHLSAGDLLRAERKREGSEVGELIEKHIREGSIVPVAITIKLILDKMEEYKATTNYFLIDGFPRNADNLAGWTENVTKHDKVNVLFVMYFECEIKTCIARCLERSKAQGRSDDNEVSLRGRIETYESQTKPIIGHFQELGLVRSINSEKSIEDVWLEVAALLKTENLCPVFSSGDQ